jgi:CDP-diacylglycerol--serine O-phosphatidyltransferase
MRPIEKNIPNLLTFGNLFCGFLAVAACISGDLVMAGWLVFIAAFFDLLDGLAARLLNAYSKTGAQLDSLSDAVSFGLVPALITYMLLVKSHAPWLELGYINDVPVYVFIPFLLAAAAVYRLAKFNISTDQAVNFKGLPTPAAAMFFASFPLMLQYDVFAVRFDIYYLSGLVLNPLFLIGCILLVSGLMISNIPLFSLKISSLKGPARKMIIVFLAVSVILFIFLLWASVPIIILLYILFSYFTKSSFNEIQSAD